MDVLLSLCLLAVFIIFPYTALGQTLKGVPEWEGWKAVARTYNDEYVETNIRKIELLEEDVLSLFGRLGHVQATIDQIQNFDRDLIEHTTEMLSISNDAADAVRAIISGNRISAYVSSYNTAMKYGYERKKILEKAISILDELDYISESTKLELTIKKRIRQIDTLLSKVSKFEEYRDAYDRATGSTYIKWVTEIIAPQVFRLQAQKEAETIAEKNQSMSSKGDTQEVLGDLGEYRGIGIVTPKPPKPPPEPPKPPPEPPKPPPEPPKPPPEPPVRIPRG